MSRSPLRNSNCQQLLTQPNVPSMCHVVSLVWLLCINQLFHKATVSTANYPALTLMSSVSLEECPFFDL